jgi:DNA helicase-2/ATP-dependent DNA helicase PcrA
MTIHRSKGLEFPVVFLIGASEGILPHSSALEADKMKDKVAEANQEKEEKMLAAIEEERRLMYVAITRAKEELYISSPSYYRGKKTEVSRFLCDVYAQTKPHESKKKPTAASSGSMRNATVISTETVLAWVCSSSQCHAWSRIVSYEDSKSNGKPCPLCGNEMIKGSKEIENKIQPNFY